MAIKSDNLVDFKKYLDSIIDELCEDNNNIYTGNIREERLNGKITSFTINLNRE